MRMGKSKLEDDSLEQGDWIVKSTRMHLRISVNRVTYAATRRK